MLEFLVLGLIPGTNIQINFGAVFDITTTVVVILAAPRLLQYADARKRAHHQN